MPSRVTCMCAQRCLRKPRAVMLAGPAAHTARPGLNPCTLLAPTCGLCAAARSLPAAALRPLPHALNPDAPHTLQVFSGHNGSVRCGGFTPDGKSLVTGGGENDASLRLWNPKNGSCTASVQGHGFHPAGAHRPGGSCCAARGHGVPGQRVHCWCAGAQGFISAILHEHRARVVPWPPLAQGGPHCCRLDGARRAPGDGCGGVWQ